MEEKVGLSSPWDNFYKEVKVLFEYDPEVKVKFNEEAEKKVIKLYVADTDKAMALEKLLPKEKVFGNIKVFISVIPPNSDELDTTTLFEKAFDKNSAFDYVDVRKVFETDNVFVVFTKEVVQYYNDDLGDANRLRSTLYQDIAKDVFKEIPNVHYCTNKCKTMQYIPARRDYRTYNNDSEF